MTLDKQGALALIGATYRVLKDQKDPSNLSLLPLLESYASKRIELTQALPEIFAFAPGIVEPAVVVITLREALGPGYPARTKKGVDYRSTGSILNEVEFVLEAWSSSNSKNSSINPMPKRVFISHGRKEDWRKVQEYVEKVLEIPTLELAQEANKGRTIFQKLLGESEMCSFAIIVMSGEDMTADEQIRARENVIHEIGYFQGKYGPDRVCLLHEDGVNIPSNIHGLVYIPFPPNGIEAAYGGLTRELKHI